MKGKKINSVYNIPIFWKKNFGKKLLKYLKIYGHRNINSLVAFFKLVFFTT